MQCLTKHSHFLEWRFNVEIRKLKLQCPEEEWIKLDKLLLLSKKNRKLIELYLQTWMIKISTRYVHAKANVTVNKGSNIVRAILIISIFIQDKVTILSILVIRQLFQRVGNHLSIVQLLQVLRDQL